MEQGGQRVRVVNLTRAMEALSPLLNHPRRTIIHVEALVTATTTLLFLQLIFGLCRRRWHNFFVKGGLTVSHALVSPLAIYTMSIMHSSPIKNVAYPVWAVCLLMASDGTNTVKQYVVDRNKMSVQYAFQISRYYFYLLMMFRLTDRRSWKETFSLKRNKHRNIGSFCLQYLFCVVYMAKYSEDILFMLVKRNDAGRAVADWMKKHANDQPDDCDPESMKGYNYPVHYPAVAPDEIRYLGRVIKGLLGVSCDTMITIDQIWGCGGELLNSDRGKPLKDVCLSFALFALLKRRYYGLACAEAGLPKTHDFVFRGLLPSEGGYERAFRIVEVELGFCYDFFFTKYHRIYRNGASVWLCFLMKVVLIPVVAASVLMKCLALETPEPMIEVHTTTVDHIITLVTLGTVLTVHLLQALFYLASDWVKVSLTCRYVTANSWQRRFLEMVIGFLSRMTIFTWRADKMGQHSVISDSTKKVKKGFLTVLFGKTRSPVDISDTVKKAIARSLVSSSGHLTNGESSQRHNEELEHYSRALKDHSQVEIMLIWHIATDYCDLSLSVEDMNGAYQQDLEVECNHEVAVNLSRYCAYLMASVPELLPYHVADTEFSTNMLVEEVRDVITVGNHSNRYEILKSLEETDEPLTVLMKGVKLGKMLELMPERVERWKVLAEFWAETILYITPSHINAKHHMEHLQKGGELLTVLWALLSHAGILKLDREKDQNRMPAQSSQEAA